MSIEILPARLANQIAAGEVVERPASVIKELVENSLDAGATQIQIDVEKGGSKRIRIIDNGSGIVKDELTLALSRHATSKIKDLNDLEAISSLGFRGEALASISSVARLTLTSKPAEQSNAWQAYAEGRDMQVVVQPAAHPNGTTIDVEDLFFNTPARKKFLRTEKTEFSHIEEVIRRIALARFDVTFILNHNHKLVRQYRAAKDKSQYGKRVAQICGQRFVEQSIEVDCQHDNLHLSGWLASPEYYRNQNDLCYSYVNGRMMRDKLINHAIRQAYADLLPRDTYPAFVLFLELDFQDVDVNVHPAKHEVRFHQSRYVHDFIFSVCNKALLAQAPLIAENELFETIIPTEQISADGEILSQSSIGQPSQNQPSDNHTASELSTSEVSGQPSYIKPLQSRESQSNLANNAGSSYQPTQRQGQGQAYSGYQSKVNDKAASAYQTLMTPLAEPVTQSKPSSVNANKVIEKSQLVKAGKLSGHFVAPSFLAISLNGQLQLVALTKLEQACQRFILQSQWQQGLVSQPLLLPIKLKVNNSQQQFFSQYQTELTKAGIVYNLLSSSSIQVRQFPALLRHKDVSNSLFQLYDYLQSDENEQAISESDWQQALAMIMANELFDQESANKLLVQATSCFESEIEAQLLLNSVTIDLTSEIHQLNQL